jgi:hypothetical protein
MINLVYVLHELNHSHIDYVFQYQYNHHFSLKNNFQLNDENKLVIEVFGVFQIKFLMMMMMLYWKINQN